MTFDCHPRRILHGFIPKEFCKELEFIHKGNCTVGYRPNVFSTTLSHLVATDSSHLIMPFVTLREKIKEQVEQAFGCEYELFIEFTGLISWTRGASIGWHSDDNRPYLKQRHYAAVCYLNSYEEHFSGGLFRFQDGEPTIVCPVAGDVVMYTADSRNIHSVDEIKDGERLTLTLWFTRDVSYDEDAKLISFLSQNVLPNIVDLPSPIIPLPASSNMYWFSSGTESGESKEFDVRVARLAVLGYDVCPSQEKNYYYYHELHSSDRLSEILEKSLKLVRGDVLVDMEFGNILHALQIVQFYVWKEEEILAQEAELETNGRSTINIPLSQTARDIVGELKRLFLTDAKLANKVLVYWASGGRRQHHFNEAGYSAAVKAWEAYSCTQQKQLLQSLPLWKIHQSIFTVQLENAAL